MAPLGLQPQENPLNKGKGVKKVALLGMQPHSAKRESGVECLYYVWCSGVSHLNSRNKGKGKG